MDWNDRIMLLPRLFMTEFRVRTFGMVSFLALGLSACAAPVPVQLNDPYEKQNRQVHQFNLAVDKNLIKPLSVGVAGKGTGPVAKGVTNFADNLGLPARVVNNVLQLRLDRAVENTVRFALNTTVGLGGVLDPASGIGMPDTDTDFGETLHVWGAGEGRYVELPVIGPSTERDTVGIVVDFFIDPLGMVPSPERYISPVANAGSGLAKRARFSETIDSILYGSADSYSQTRLLYLQNRRYDLGQSTGDESFEDPYEVSNGQ